MAMGDHLRRHEWSEGTIYIWQPYLVRGTIHSNIAYFSADGPGGPILGGPSVA